jgi:Protein of unknown function (DUF3176)
VTAAAAGLVATSHNSPVEHWKVQGVSIQPQVWLSVLTTLMDGLAMFALAEGVTMLFWRVAGQGSTVRSDFNIGHSQKNPLNDEKLQNLHYIYESHYILGSLKQLGRGRLSLTVVSKFSMHFSLGYMNLVVYLL